MNDLDSQRQTLIERIKQVFPEKPSVHGKGGLKLLEDYVAPYDYQHLRETLEGKLWEEIISEPSIIYTLSEIDYIRDMTDEAYMYYLPAFLVATLNNPLKWAMYSMVIETIYDLRAKFTPEQIDVLIAFFDFHARLQRSYPQYPNVGNDFLEAIEDIQLKLMLWRDKL